MGPIGFVIPTGIALALLVALAKGAKAKEAPPPEVRPPEPPQPPTPPGYMPPPQPRPPQPPVDEDEDYGIPSMPPPPAVPPPTPMPPEPSQPPVMETPSGPILLKSPFKNVSSKQWSRFVLRMARAEEGTITRGARYGMFLFGVRRLADLGLVDNVKRGTYQGQTVWTGTWVPPYSESKFLESSKLQYRVFVASMKQYAAKYAAARKQNPALFRIKTKPLTLSGFLAFAHVAGFMGAIKSLKQRKIRPETLSFVEKVNGLF